MGLTLANQSVPPGGYGGHYGGGSYCIDDYWQGAPSPLPAVSIPASVSGKQKVYASGDVYIGNDIIYSGSGTWNRDTIPSFWLIVRGNIYIGSNVTRLDGTFVALPDPTTGTGGKIFTCSNNNPSSPGSPNDSQIVNECRQQQLRVNGALIASQIKLLRTFCTLYYAAPQEVAGTATPGNCAAGATKAGEIINYNPQAWLSMPDLGITSTSPDADSITSLAPIL
jgi:hypothetical protein